MRVCADSGTSTRIFQSSKTPTSAKRNMSGSKRMQVTPLTASSSAQWISPGNPIMGTLTSGRQAASATSRGESSSVCRCSSNSSPRKLNGWSDKDHPFFALRLRPTELLSPYDPVTLLQNEQLIGINVLKRLHQA